MSTKHVLNEDWSAYDNKKEKAGGDRNYFDCKVNWEIDFLIDLIAKY